MSEPTPNDAIQIRAVAAQEDEDHPVEPEDTPTVRRRIPMEDLKSMNGLRGVCAVVVVLGHFAAFFTTWLEHFGLDLQSVGIFFALSGMAHARFYCHNDAMSRPNGYRKYYVKRFARIGPVYYLSLLVYLPILFFMPVGSFKCVVGNGVPCVVTTVLTTLTFLQDVLVLLFWNGVLWQVSVFMICYAIYPKTEASIRRRSTKQLFWIAVALYMFPLLCVVAIPTVGGLMHLTVVRAFHFYCAVLCGEMFERRRDSFNLLYETVDTNAGATNEAEPTPRKNAAFPTINTAVWADIVSLVLFISFIFQVFVFPRALIVPPLVEFGFLPLHCVWIAFLTEPDNTSFTRRALSTRPMLVLGELSYSVYCLHFPLLIYVAIGLSQIPIWKQRANRPKPIPIFKLPLYLVFVFLVVIVGISACVYKWVENPCREKIIARCLKRKKGYQRMETLGGADAPLAVDVVGEGE